MATTNAMVLNERLHQSLGDWLSFSVTTNIGAGVNVDCTTLNQYDGGQQDTFKDKWLFMENYNNAGDERKIHVYHTSGGVCNVWGAALTADVLANIAKIRIGTYSYTACNYALNDALRETYPILYKNEIDESLATNSLRYEYDLPSNLIGGSIYQVAMNSNLVSSTPAEAETFDELSFEIVNSGQTLRLSDTYDSGHLIRIKAMMPLEEITSTTTEVNIAPPLLNMLIVYAKYLFYDRYGSPVSSEDREKFDRESAKAYGEYLRLKPRGLMMRPTVRQSFR